MQVSIQLPMKSLPQLRLPQYALDLKSGVMTHALAVAEKNTKRATAR
jgi:hypothetical protein